ncbi:hypothetical protein [Anaerotignum sp.]|nr:hypothetical protein [Anaerotignum sp.]MBQ7759000.1 hypothetical protein [Anaerotignum sp.]
MKKLISMVLSTLFLLTPTTAFANSAQTYFRGIAPSGAMITGEQSPIIVQHEQLTFDIQEFPLDYYREEGAYLAYSGKVTAEYTFHNPADYDVTAKLAFPFGQTPDYGYSFHPHTDKQVFAADAKKYDVLVDGKPVESTVRHTLFYRGDEFELEKDLPNLHDGYMEDPFWNFDTPVTKYTWEISGIAEEFDAARLGFWWDGDATERKLMLMNQSGGNNSEDKIAVTRWVENGDTIEVYVFGKPLEGELEWFSENGAEDTPFDYELTLVGEETATYEEFVFADWEDNSTVLRHDWYNAVTQNLKKCEWDFGILGSFEYTGRFPVENLLRWYEYEITVPAGGTIVNTVTAPMYPDANVRYEPPIYTYHYLLSPAKTWAEFGTLDIVVHTPNHMLETNLQSFEKNENGYQSSYDGLPDGELTFTLSEDASPKVPNSGLPFWSYFVICFAAYEVVTRVKKRKKEK